MKLAEKMTSLLESDDLEGIADYLSNALEHEENEEDAIHFLVSEYGLKKPKASSLLAAWWETPAKQRLNMKLKDQLEWIKFKLN